MHWMCCKLVIKKISRPYCAPLFNLAGSPCKRDAMQWHLVSTQTVGLLHTQANRIMDERGGKKKNQGACCALNLTDTGSEKQRVWAVIRGECVFLELKLICIYSRLLLLNMGNQCFYLFAINHPRWGPWSFDFGRRSGGAFVICCFAS